MNFKSISSKLSLCLALTLSLHLEAQNDLGLEAIVAPQIGYGIGEDSQLRYGVDFYRVSSGISLFAGIGSQEDQSELTLLFRLSSLEKIFGESLSRGLIWGLGAGMSYNPLSKKAGTDPEIFSDVIFNPYIRYLFDINGWVGPYVELGYEYRAYRHYWSDVASAQEKDPSNSIMFSVGFAFEAERSRAR